MKTAMQELIDALEAQGLEMFGMDEFLEKEKQQIIDAHNDGGLDGDKMGTIYYNETFKND